MEILIYGLPPNFGTNIKRILVNQPTTARCCFSIPPENIIKLVGFLFSGGIEKQHRAVMG